MSALAMIALGLALTAEPKAEEAKPYSFVTSGTTAKLKAGADGRLKLQIRAAKGYHVSREAPLKIKLSSEGVKLAKLQLGQKDSTDEKSPEPLFDVPFSAPSAGEQSIAADASFFVCSDTICERKTEKLTVAVKVDP